MLKKLVIPLMIVLMAGIASAISMTMELPSGAAIGETFNMNLITSGSSGNYGILYSFNITGGCTAAGNTHKTGGFFDEVNRTTVVSIKAPSIPATCTFTGDYQFALDSGIQSLTNFPTKSVTITSSATTTPPACTASTWSPSRSDKCTGTSFIQTSNCGTTRSSTGTKVCDTGSTGDTSKGSGSGAIFLFVIAGIVLFFIAIKE